MDEADRKQLLARCERCCPLCRSGRVAKYSVVRQRWVHPSSLASLPDPVCRAGVWREKLSKLTAGVS